LDVVVLGPSGERKDRLFLRIGRRLTRSTLIRTGLGAIASRALRPGLYVLSYHRIGDWRATSYDAGVFTCEAARFREHLALLGRRFDLVNLETLRKALKQGTAPARPMAMLTFDDGYRDNYLVAFPILKEMGATAVFFLPTAFIGTGVLPWWDQVAWMVRHAAAAQIQLPYSEGEIPVKGDVDRAVIRVLGWFKRTDHVPVDEKLAAIREACGSPAFDASESPQLFMSWAEAREMHAAGMAIGSHTHTHSILSHLSGADQEDELGRSREILESELRAPVDTLAYPVGRSFCYTEDTISRARKVGYRLAFNHTNAIARLPTRNLLDVPRLVIEDRGSKPQLEFALSLPELAG
jgi:peptidoglycan/xylan/chitin deacetylase (PgdA/CDA1 family)